MDKHRAAQSDELNTEFTVTVPLTAQWDGKLLEDLTTREHIDRLPIIISGVGVVQLLGVFIFVLLGKYIGRQTATRIHEQEA